MQPCRAAQAVQPPHTFRQGKLLGGWRRCCSWRVSSPPGCSLDGGGGPAAWTGMWSWFRPVRFAAGKLCREAQRAWQRSELPMAPGRPVRPASCRRSAARPAAEEQAQVTHCCTGGCRSTSPSERGRLSSSSSLAEWQPGGSGGRGGGGDEQCQRHEAAARRCFGRAGHGLKSVQGGVRLRLNQVCCSLTASRRLAL